MSTHGSGASCHPRSLPACPHRLCALVASRGSGAMNARDGPLLGPGSSHDSARRTAQHGLALFGSRPQKDAVTVSLVVQLHHQLVKVAEVEDDRHAESPIYLDALQKQPVDERPARLGRVVVGPVAWCLVDGVALYRRESVRTTWMRAAQASTWACRAGRGSVLATSRRISASRLPFDLGCRTLGSMSIDPSSSCCPCQSGQYSSPSHG